jgi:hypothetical protein
MGTPHASDFLTRSTAWTAGFSVAIIIGLVVGWPHFLVAQTPDSDSAIRVGDLWIYDAKNEVTGLPAEGFTEMVAQVSSKEITVNRTYREPVYRWPQSYLVTYDHDWDRVDDLSWKFKPNNGLGVRLPLSVGKTWRAEFDAEDLQTTRRTYRGTSSSRVVAQESITTDAGSFDTFKIEQQARWLDPRDPARAWEFQVVTWYAPQINHWVRRTELIKFDKRVRYNTSVELADFTRKL